MKYCKNCGNKLEEGQQVCLKCGSLVDEKVRPTSNVQGGRTKIVAGTLGIFLGAFGSHNFYLGYIGKGIAQLLLTIFSCGMLAVVSGIWGFVEGILILTGSISTDADGNPLSD